MPTLRSHAEQRFFLTGLVEGTGDGDGDGEGEGEETSVTLANGATGGVRGAGDSDGDEDEEDDGGIDGFGLCSSFFFLSTHSLKHFEQRLPNSELPKKPQPLAHKAG